LAGYQPKGDYALRSEIPAVPTKLSQLADDSTHRLVTDAEKAAWSAKSDFSGSYNDLTDKPTIPAVPVQSVNGKTGAVKLTASDVGADPAGTAVAVVSEHNADPNAHQDIRLALQQLAERINAVLDSDDATLDELSEIVAYIKSNKTLIDAISTSKVNVSDIINNLTTNVANKPLSAAQGVALKALIDAITVPTKVSQLTNDAGYLTEHQDISGKLDADKLPEAVNDALAQAKASGVFDGADGKDGSDANVTAQNVTAALGYTPADAEKVRQLSEEVDAIGTRDQIVQDVLDAIGTPVFGVVDEENNIILTGALADGTYTLKYEFEDGTVSEVGTIEVGSSMPTSGTVELVWENGVKIDKATGVAGSGSAYAASQHIELWDGYTYTATQQMVNGHIFSGISICYYAEDGSYLGYEELWASDSNPHTAVFTPLANAATFRVRGYFTTDYYTECVSVTYEKTA